MRKIQGVYWQSGHAHLYVAGRYVRVLAFDSEHCYFAQCADGVVRARMFDGTWY